MSSKLPANIKPRTGRANHAVLLTETQYDWAAATIQKRAKLAANLRGQPKLRSLIASLDEKLTLMSTTTPPERKLECSRQELRVLADVIANTITGINDKILPEYERRLSGGKVSEAAELLKERRAELKKLIKELKALSKQAESVYAHGSERRESDYGKR